MTKIKDAFEDEIEKNYREQEERGLTEPQDTKHYSDCAVHNAPAYEPGPCDCGGFVDHKAFFKSIDSHHVGFKMFGSRRSFTVEELYSAFKARIIEETREEE